MIYLESTQSTHTNLKHKHHDESEGRVLPVFIEHPQQDTEHLSAISNVSVHRHYRIKMGLLHLKYVPNSIYSTIICQYIYSAG